MKRLLLLLASVMLLAFVVACSDDDNGDATGTPDATATGTPTADATEPATETPAAGETLRIGALLPTSGALQSYGENSAATLAAAVDAINAEGDRTIELVIEDTNSDPVTALERLQALYDDGIRVVIGPYSSSEVSEVLDFANDNGILLLSPLSTANALATPDDVLFRFTPDDIEEGVAVANLAWADGVRTMILAYRDDVGNAGLAEAVRDAFEEIGGTVVDGIVYASNETDFADEVASLEMALADLDAPAEEVGVYLAAFAEVRDLLEAASAAESLSNLRWYGSNSVALSTELLENETASEFAIATGYPNPILGRRDADEAQWGPVVEQVATDLGHEPDSFALAAYDALVIAHAALTSVDDATDVEALKAAIVEAADATTGLTGPLTLNEAGDRALATYDFWGVCSPADGEFSWIRVATFEGGGEAQRLEATCE